MAQARHAVRGSRNWIVGLAMTMVTMGVAQAQAVSPRLLPAAAFTAPTLELLAGCGVPEQAAIAIRVISEIPGATNANVPPPATWCTRLPEATPEDPTSSEVVQLDQTDFVSNDGGKTLDAVGREGDLGTLDTRSARGQVTAGASGGFWSFLKRAPQDAASAPTASDGTPAVPPSFTYVATPDLLLFSRPGGIFAFDRHFRRFCPAGIAQPGVAAQRAMYQISDGRLLIVTWSLPERDKAAVQSAVLVVPPSLCPPVTPGS